MKTMVERVAKALFEVDYPEAGEVEEGDWAGKEAYNARAHAAIEAMREPSSRMIGAATGVPIQSNVVSETYVLDDEASAIWQAMINAALEENEK